jgi:hypothetical protein
MFKNKIKINMADLNRFTSLLGGFDNKRNKCLKRINNQIEKK